MNILLPMGGRGIRFIRAGYVDNKLELPVYVGTEAKQVKMIMAALNDFPDISLSRLVCVDTEEYEKNGVENLIRSSYPHAFFVHDNQRKGQLQGCLLAENLIDLHDEIFIGVCDSGMEYDIDAFVKLKEEFDVIVFTHSGSEVLRRNPSAHSWLVTQNNIVLDISLKKTISQSIHQDQATTGFFWYKSSDIFFQHAKLITHQSQREMYVDEVAKHSISEGLKVSYLNVSLKCWGTPVDYEEYQKSYQYWYDFFERKKKC